MGVRPQHLLAPLFVAVCGYLLYAIQGEVRERTVASALAAQGVHARQAARGIEGFFAQHLNMLGYLGSLEPVVRMGPEGEALLAAYQEYNAELSAVSRLDASGRLIYTVPPNPAALGSDLSQQAHVRTLLAHRKPVVSDVFMAVQGYRTMALHVPVFEGEVFHGSLALLIPFEVLARNFLRELRVGESGHGWLLNQHGTELYCGNPSHVGAPSGEVPGEPAARQLVRRMVAGEQGSAAIDGSSHLGPQVEAGRFVAAFVPVKVVDTSWSIAVAAGEGEILSATEVFRVQWMGTVGMLGVGLLLYGLIAVRTRVLVREAAVRKRAAAALEASYDTVRTILDGLGAEVYVADLTSGELLFLNQRLRQRCGEEAEGKPCWQVLHGGSGPCPACEGDGLLDAAGEPVGVVTWEDQDPETQRWRLHQAQALHWIDGRRVRLQMTTDITDRKQDEVHRQRIEKLESLGVLAGGIAHDFNNLLMGILGNLSLARQRAGRGESITGLLGEAEHACVRASALTRQLLTFSKGGEPIKQLAAVDEIVREACDFALRGSPSRAEYDIASELWRAEVDPGQVSQVIHNLAINADHAMPGGGLLSVRIRNVRLDGREPPLPAGPYLQVVVRDEGVGIDPQHLPRIFDPYFTTKGQGNGLGLASSHSIVRRHGGHIGVSSRQSEGTCFTMYLPARPDAQPVAAPVPIAEPGEGKGRILVMDDEEVIRDVAEALLTAGGYRCATAGDGATAVTLYREALAAGDPFDAVILDLTVPGGMGGEAALRQLKELDPRVVAVVSSGYSADPILADPAARGFAGRLVKPYSLHQLGRVLGECLAASRAATADPSTAG